MKKILNMILAATAILCLAACSKFPHQGTATESIAGNWVCTVYAADGTEWFSYSDYYGCAFEYMTYNTAANLSTEIWLDDNKNFWGTKCKIDADVANLSFGSNNKEYKTLYGETETTQKIFGGKVTKKGAIAPGSKSEVDKIEFYIKFSDDETPYSTVYYVVGYKLTGFPEDNGVYKDDWDLPSVPVQ